MIYLGSALSFISCVNNDDEALYPTEPDCELSWQERLSLIDDHTGEWSEQDVINTINLFSKEIISSEDTRSSSTPVIRSITRRDKNYIHSIKSKSSNSDIQTFDVKLYDQRCGELLAVVAGDKQSMRVLYYGTVPPVDNPEECAMINKLIALAQEQQITTIQETEKIRNKYRNQAEKKIKNYLDDQITRAVILDSIYDPIGGHLAPLTDALAFVKPLTKTSWHQSNPYNWEMPIVWKELTESQIYHHQGRSSAGCAVVAIGQLLAVTKPYIIGQLDNGRGVTIDWNYAIGETGTLFHSYLDGGSPKDSPIKQLEMVGGLLRKIYEDTDSYLVNLSEEGAIFPKYGVDTPADKMVDFLHEYATFDGVWNTPFSKESAMRSLINKSPVLIYGVGTLYGANDEVEDDNFTHTWLIDGYSICRGYVNRNVKDLYWSVNLGYSWNSKCYFYVSSLDPNFSIMTYPINDGYVYFDTREQYMLYNFKNKTL